MEKINLLRICYWCSLLISAFMLITVFHELTFKDFIMSLIMICTIGDGYIDSIIDEEKKSKYGNNKSIY